LYQLALGSTQRTSSDLAPAFEAQLGGPEEMGRAIARGLSRLVGRCLTPAPEAAYRAMDDVCHDLEGLAQMLAAPRPRAAISRQPVTSVHAPARRAQVAVGGPKVIVRGS
jgi:hypothetical protein